MKEAKFLCITDLLKIYNQKKISPVEHLEKTIINIEKQNPKLDAFISIDKENALIQAEISKKKYSDNKQRKLEGIPFGIKDVIDVKGEKTQNGSRIFIDSKKKIQNANIVEKLKNEGAIYIGKLNTFELAIGAPTFNSLHSPSKNPWKLKKTTGGSSSGSGAAVGGFLVPLAIGTDSGGSIRNPSSMCGIVGLKPTFDSVNMNGIQPLARSIDNVGPMVRSGKDCELIYSILNRKQNIEKKKIKNLRIGIIEHFYNKDMIADDEVASSFEKTVKIFEKCGAKISRVNLQYLLTYHRVNGTIMAREGYLQNKNILKKNKNIMCEITYKRLILGGSITDENYNKCIDKKKELSLEINEILSSYDILLTLTNFDLPFDIGNIEQIEKQYMRHARSPFNVSGNPSVSIPCGLSKTELPIGFQIIGKIDTDRQIANIAEEYLNIIEWNKTSEEKIYSKLYS